MANEDAMRVLMSIEGFRSLNQDIEKIINKSESVNWIFAKTYAKTAPHEYVVCENCPMRTGRYIRRRFGISSFVESIDA